MYLEPQVFLKHLMQCCRFLTEVFLHFVMRWQAILTENVQLKTVKNLICSLLFVEKLQHNIRRKFHGPRGMSMKRPKSENPFKH